MEDAKDSDGHAGAIDLIEDDVRVGDERSEIWAQFRTFSAAAREVLEDVERGAERRLKRRIALRISLGVPCRRAS